MKQTKIVSLFLFALVLVSLLPFISQTKATSNEFSETTVYNDYTDFESGLNGWKRGPPAEQENQKDQWSSSQCIRDSRSHSPTHSTQMMGDDCTAYTLHAYGICKNYTFHNDANVTFDFWGYTAYDWDDPVYIDVWNISNNAHIIEYTTIFGGSDEWRHKTFTFPDNCTGFEIAVYVSRDTGSIFEWWDDFNITEVYSTTFANIDIDIPQPGEPGGLSCDGWMFAEEKYYTFTANITWSSNQTLDTLKYYFLDGAENNVSWLYSYGDDLDFPIGSSDKYITVGRNASCTVSNQSYVVKTSIWLKWEIIDRFDADLYCWFNSTGGSSSDWFLALDDFCHIYSRGGLEELERSGPAGRLVGGEPFMVYANKDSWARSNLYYRNLVHSRMMLTLYWERGNPPDEFPSVRWYFGYEYFVNGEWVNNGFYFFIGLASFAYGADHQYAKFNVWVYRNSIVIANSTLFGFYNSYNSEFRIWVDLWINKANASSIFGTRVLSYYYAMQNNADVWLRWLTGNNWGIMLANSSIVNYFGELKDINGSRAYSPKIELVRLWTKIISFPSEYDYLAKTIRVDVWNLQFDDRGEGIASPPFEEQKTPTMPQGGFLGVLATWFERLQLAVGSGVMDYWLVFVGWIDVIFAWAGWPNGFSQIIYWISSFGGWITNSFTWLITVLTSFFGLAATFIGKMLNTLANIFGAWAGMFTIIFDLIDGGYGAGMNLWTSLGLSTWVTLFAILYPFFLLTMWEMEGLDAVVNHLNGIKDMLAWFLTQFITVIQIFIRLIGRIIESIPVVE